MILNFNYKVSMLQLIVVAVFVSLAAFNFANAQLAEGVTQDQIDAALGDLSDIYGDSVVSQDQAREICNMDQYATDCAEIGKEHDLFPPERAAQVDTILNEIKGDIADQIKTCQTIECLVGVAEGLATNIARKNPSLASQIDLTPKIVKEKKEIVEIAKSAGLTIDQCINMDPDTASIELLRGCARLAKTEQVQKYLPAEAKANVNAIAESTERTVQLKQSLEGGQYQCGDGTIEGCGNFCLNPSTEARSQGVPAIPQVCRDIANKFFGAQGAKDLENAYTKVSNVADYYYKKAENFVFTTLDGRTLTNPQQIGQYLEQQGKAGNVEAISKGMDFMITQGLVTPADKDFAVKMVSKFRERGGIDFDACSQNPKACQDYIHEDFQDSFNAMDKVFEIMTQELGFSPDLCEQGDFDPTIGLKCLEGGKRALPQIQALAAQYPEVQFIVNELTSNLQRGEQLAQKKGQFDAGTFSGPGGCRNERECFNYCSNPVNGPECISFGAKEGFSGYSGEQAVTKYQQYDYSLNRSNIDEKYITSGGTVYGGAGYPPSQGYQPYGAPTYGTATYGPSSYYSPYYPPYPSPSSGPGDHSYGPSPECVSAIKSGDFAKAKQVCDVGIGGPGQQPFPTNPPICPASPYVECPAGQYHESFRNNDGCWIDGPCKPIPSFVPGPYPTPGPGDTPQCSDGRDNDNDGKTDYPADSSCYGPQDYDEYYPPEGSPYPTVSGQPCPPGQWWDGAANRCTSSSSCGYGLYWDPSSQSCKPSGGTYPPYPTGSPGGKPQCSDSIDNDNDGKTDYPADSSCYGPEDWDEYYPIEGGPYPSYTPGPGTGSCPSGYHWHGESGGFCMNDREDYSGTCYSYDGKTTIKCPSQTSQCPSPQWWDPAKGYCVGSTSPSPWPSPGISSCPAGYHSHGDSGGFCMNDREDYSGTCYSLDGKTTIKCPTQTYPSPQTCPSGQWWDYSRSACVSSTATYTPYPSCPSGQWWDTATSKCTLTGSSCGSGYYWDSASNVCKPSGGTYTPAPSCPSGQWWDYANNYCRTDCLSGMFWDPAQKKCVSSGGTTGNCAITSYNTSSYGNCNYSTCPNGCNWENSCPKSCYSGSSYTPYPSCPSGQWWDSASSSCKSSSVGVCGNGYCDSNESSSSCPSDCGSTTGGTTYTPYPSYTPSVGYCGDHVCGSSESSSSCPSDCGSTTGGTTYTPYPTTEYTPYPTTQYTPYPTTEYTPYPTTSYTPMPNYSPPPPTSGILYNHYAAIHCAGLGRDWDGQYCQPEGFLARTVENTWAALGKLIGF